MPISVDVIQDHLNRTAYLSTCLLHALHDWQRLTADRESGYRLSYNIDFHLLNPILFEKPGAGSNAFLADVPDWMPKVLDFATRPSCPYKILLAVPHTLNFLINSPIPKNHSEES